MELDRDSAAELLGAYVLDALDAPEADAVERALATFPELRGEHHRTVERRLLRSATIDL